MNVQTHESENVYPIGGFDEAIDSRGIDGGDPDGWLFPDQLRIRR